MQSSQALRYAMAKLLAADPNTLAPATAGAENQLALVQAPFTPSESLTFAQIQLASFTGSTPIKVPMGAQEVGLDPATADGVINFIPPATGFRWVTTDDVNLPQTIYGYVLLNGAGDTVMASELFDLPIQLNAAGQIAADLNPDLRALAGTLV